MLVSKFQCFLTSQSSNADGVINDNFKRRGYVMPPEHHKALTMTKNEEPKNPFSPYAWVYRANP